MERAGKVKVAVISLGCDKNRVDSEKMLSSLIGGGFELTSENQAQVIIINTCAFIESARKEAIETILSCVRYKSDKCEKLVVTGCLPQKYLNELKADLPEVDAFLGVNDYDKINQIIGGLTGQAQNQNVQNSVSRVITTPFNYAYLKIADGCDNKCTYCTIPSIRGHYRSQKIEDLKRETQSLAENGVKEIVLVAQDVTNYGIDLYAKRCLVELIRALSETDIEWIRLMYCYPELIDAPLIDEIASNPKVLKYLDMPLQHIDDRILRLMNRRGNSTQIKSLINELRARIPDIALRTTFITGFPSETDAEFNTLKEFVAEYKFNHVGVFVYSLESDTPSAKIKPGVSAKIARQRRKELMLAQQENVALFNKNAVGKTFKVLHEGIDYKKSLFFGRAYFNAPEVDPLIYFKADFAESGCFYDIKITSFDGYDLLGEKPGFKEVL